MDHPQQPQQATFIATPTFQGFAPQSNPYYPAGALYAPPIPPQPSPFDVKAYARAVESPRPNWARWFTVLLAAALALNALMVFVWLVSGHGFPWFIYVLSGSWLLLGSCYILCFSQENKLFRLHLLLSVDLNVTVFLTYLFAFTSHPWFVYVLCPTVGLLLAHYFLLPADDDDDADARNNSGKVDVIEEGESGKWRRWRDPLFRIHLWAFFVPLNIMLFVCWTATSPSTPWFIYPLLSTAMGPVVHYLLAYEAKHAAGDAEAKSADRKKRWFLAHLALCSAVNFMLFVAWYDAGAGFPWFVFPAIAWYGVVVLHSLRAFSIKKQQLVELGRDHYHSAMHMAGSFQSAWTSPSPPYPTTPITTAPYGSTPTTPPAGKDASPVGREEEEAEQQFKKGGGDSFV